MPAKIANITKESPAWYAGLEAGDTILSINDTEINDYLDYMYASCAEKVAVTTDKSHVIIENYDFEPLGISFDTLLIDKPKSCRNKCVFCFIDQLPKGMRDTCYFKDDDYRLSFLQGNYVTMTNMTDEDIDRIIKYNIPRINISVHTTNPELRCKMLNNRFAGKITDYLKKLSEGGLNINGQIVLCPGLNDGAELDRTISDISALGDSVESISIVPVGLSDHRRGLAELKKFDKESSAAVIKQVGKWQQKFRKERGTNLIYLSDEFYLNAKLPFPPIEAYDGFPQLENGVGMCVSLIDEFTEALNMTAPLAPKLRKTVVTGISAYPVITKLVNMLNTDKINVIPVVNDFFGHDITVTGLLTGQDIINQLKTKDLGDEVLISESMLRRGDSEEVLLDNTTVADLRDALKCNIVVVGNNGFDLFDALK